MHLGVTHPARVIELLFRVCVCVCVCVYYILYRSIYNIYISYTPCACRRAPLPDPLDLHSRLCSTDSAPAYIAYVSIRHSILQHLSFQAMFETFRSCQRSTYQIRSIRQHPSASVFPGSCQRSTYQMCVCVCVLSHYCKTPYTRTLLVLVTSYTSTFLALH